MHSMSRNVVRRVSRLANKRFYSSAGQSGRSEGATVNSRGGFSDKEKAIENQWARTHDEEKLKQLRKELEEQQKKTEELKKGIEELEKASKK